MHIGKAGTDVLLIGKAWAPDKRPVQRMQVGMKVADRQKLILVTGDRVWQDGVPSSPAVRVDAPPLGACVRRRASRRRRGRGRGAQPGGMWIRGRACHPRPCRDFPFRTSRIPRRRCSRSVRPRTRPAWRRSRRHGCPAARMPAPTTSGGSAGAPRICLTISIRGSSSVRSPSSRSIAICRRRTGAHRRRDAGRSDLCSPFPTPI